MLETKVFEVRDRCTLIPILATRLFSEDRSNKAERKLVEREGFFEVDLPGKNRLPIIIVTKLRTLDTYFSVHDCTNKEVGRTLPVAMKYIQAGRWATLRSGDVIDVEFILKETAQPKESEYK